MNKQDLIDTFPIGVRYGQYRDLQENQWDKDMANMRDCGMDVIRLHAYWSESEPHEGEYHFELYDRFIEKAASYGIRTLFTLYHMSTPEWVFRKHPEARFVDAKGNVWDSNQHPDNAQGGWPGMSFDDPAFRATFERYVEAFVTHYRGNDSVIAIDIWHEPTEEAQTHYGGNDWKENQFNYNASSIAGFRDWLRSKYGTLDALNHAWTRYFETWTDVQPPRNMGTYTDWLDWKTYRLDAMSDAIHWVGSLVKKYDPDRATTVHSGIQEFGHPMTHHDDRFRLADATDMYACSLYDPRKEDVAGFSGDLMRSANGGVYWVGETGSGAGPIFMLIGTKPDQYHAWAKAISPERITKLQWTSIARGAKGVIFWSWRPERSSLEILSNGFTERDGGLTAKTEALKSFTSVIRRHRKALAEARVSRNDVAILMNMDASIIEGVSSITSAVGGFIDFNSRFYKDYQSIIGLYRLCMKNGITPDFINQDMLRKDDLSKYRLIITPFDVSVTDEDAAAMKRYVAEGGTILSDAYLGFFGNAGWGAEVCPAGGLDQVFGLHTSAEYIPVETCGVQVDGVDYPDSGVYIRENIFVHPGSEVLGAFEDGKPAVVRNAYGKGKTVYIGDMFFINARKQGLGATNALFRKLLQCCGYEMQTAIAVSEGTDEDTIIDVRHMVFPGGEFVFIINHSEQAVAAEIETKVSVAGNVTEILSGTDVGPQESDVFRLNVELKPLEVRVYQIV